MKRILFCTPASLTRAQGAAKVVVELAEEMQTLGWDCTLLCPADIAAPGNPAPQAGFAANLRAYLKVKAGDYDVVDYDHEYLPYPRAEFSPQTLFVARSVLLAQHLDRIILPTGRSLKSRAGTFLKTAARVQASRQRVCRAQTTVEEADLINVSNTDDRAELMRRGIAGDRIVVLPYGISRARRLLFDRISGKLPMQPAVAFVGTFDYRKGAREFPEIVRRVAAAVPGVCFHLLGTKGMFQTEAEVRAHFPEQSQKHLRVIPTYAPDDLPALLSACSVGVFPSYMEGMPFGVLEMLAASVPVVVYNAPGAPMLLSAEYLVCAGDAEAIAQKVIALLLDPNRLAEARIGAKQRSQQFTWTAIAEETTAVYSEHLGRKRGGG